MNIRNSINILFVGDSITCEGHRPRGFITKINAVIPIRKTVICESGASSAEILNRLRKASLLEEYHFIIAQSGINDLMNGLSIIETKERQHSLFSYIKKEFPESNILFLPMHPIIKEGVIISSDFKYNPKKFENWWNFDGAFSKKFLIDDGIHINSLGQTEIAKNLILEILKFKKDLNFNKS